MPNRLIFWIVVLAAGVGLLILANTFRDELPNPNSISQATPSPSESATPSLGPSIPPLPEGNTSPATCQLAGEIRFINENLYETRGAKIAYQNVDDETRQIFWKSEPNDGVLVIGPNLFENLVIPNGEREIGVVLKEQPTVQNYTLTASITYGVKNLNGDIESRIANCSGTINVDTSAI